MTDTPRLKLDDVARMQQFTPVCVKCEKCGQAAEMWPDWAERVGQCKCKECGALYRIACPESPERIAELPLWFKASFRKNVFWALNSDHIDYLEKIVRMSLRERPKGTRKDLKHGLSRRRLSFTSAMPFNLPAWILSAKSRPDLIRLIRRLRSSRPDVSSSRKV